jgi:hypothetical protein
MTAADGNSTHSPFTDALLKHLVTPGLDVRLAFGLRDEMLANTGNKHEPFVYGSLSGSMVTLAALNKDDRADVPPVGDPDAPAARDYEAASKVGTKEAWDAFLSQPSSNNNVAVNPALAGPQSALDGARYAGRPPIVAALASKSDFARPAAVPADRIPGACHARDGGTAEAIWVS